MNRRATLINGHQWTTGALNSRAACRLRTVCEQVGVTEREHEVCQWLMQGKTHAEIAAILSISPRTAEKHVHQLLSKLGVENRTAATFELIRQMRHPET